MAKIKLGAIVTDIRGKLGGHVFSKNKAGSYMRTKVTPSNPQTASQNWIRSIFATISSAWSSLTETQLLSFRSKVSQFMRTDIFGDIKTPSGKALHHRLNQNLAISGQALVDVCPDSKEVATSTLDAVELTLAGGSLNMHLAGDATGSKVLVFATPSVSKGTRFVKNKLRLLGVVDGAVDNSENIGLIYQNKYGNLSATDNIYFGVKFINDNGQASPMQTVKMTTV